MLRLVGLACLVWCAAASSKGQAGASAGKGQVTADVVELTGSSFDTAVLEAAALFVSFVTPECNDCKQLSSTWEALPKVVDSVTVARVDCEASRSLCERLGVSSYPTLTLFAGGKAVHFEGSRLEDELVAFADGGWKKAMSGAEDFVASVEVGADGGSAGHGERWAEAGGRAEEDDGEDGIVDLDDDTFEHQTQAATGATTGTWLVYFYAPWCPHCKAFSPKYRKVARALKSRNVPVVVARVDATKAPRTSRRFEIRSFPSLRLLRGGRMWEFPGDTPRTVASVVAFASRQHAVSKSSAVPKPLTFLSSLADEAAEAYKDIGTLVRTKPNAVSVIATAGFTLGVVIMLVIALLTNWLVPMPDIPAEGGRGRGASPAARSEPRAGAEAGAPPASDSGGED